jgi:enoyl-CoA hydratase
MTEDLVCRVDDAVTTITFNHPERGNAFSDEMTEKLTSLIRLAEQDSRLVILNAQGSDFCIGRVSGGSRSSDPYDRRKTGDIIFNCYNALKNSRIPTVAVVRGRAYGFGCAVAACCDLTFAEDATTFALPEMAHNVMPGNAMSALVGNASRKAITFLALSTQPVSAHMALAMGIVSQVWPVSALDDEVEKFVARMLHMPQAAVEAVKEYTTLAPELSAKGSLELARNLHATLNSSSHVKKKLGDAGHP